MSLREGESQAEPSCYAARREPWHPVFSNRQGFRKRSLVICNQAHPGKTSLGLGIEGVERNGQPVPCNRLN